MINDNIKLSIGDLIRFYCDEGTLYCVIYEDESNGHMSARSIRDTDIKTLWAFKSRYHLNNNMNDTFRWRFAHEDPIEDNSNV